MRDSVYIYQIPTLNMVYPSRIMRDAEAGLGVFRDPEEFQYYKNMFHNLTEIMTEVGFSDEVSIPKVYLLINYEYYNSEPYAELCTVICPEKYCKNSLKTLSSKWLKLSRKH